MLDFYLIQDVQTKPSYPEKLNLEYISGLDSITFDDLIKKGIIDSRFNYYSDFRWDSQLVKQINLKISNYTEIDKSVEQLSLILKRAIKFKSGIIAYCD